MGPPVGESTPLSGARRRRPLWKLVAGGVAAVGMVGVSVSLSPRRTRTALTINNMLVDDIMEVECVSRTLSTSFLLALGQAAGWQKLPSPVGATILVDRGNFKDLRNMSDSPGAYDWAAVNGALVGVYDAIVGDALAGAQFVDPEWQYTCTMAPSESTGCSESCVQSRFQFMDDGAFAQCADPVEAAFLLAPDLIKSCLVDEVRDAATGGALGAYNKRTYGSPESCYECVSLCVGEARVDTQFCEWTGTTKHDSLDLVVEHVPVEHESLEHEPLHEPVEHEAVEHEALDHEPIHEPIEHDAIEHDAIEHEAVDHEAVDHEAVDHDGLEHEPLHEAVDHDSAEHDGLEHERLDHDAIEHDGLEHESLDHDAIEHDGLEHEVIEHDAVDRDSIDHEGLEHEGLEHESAKHGDLEHGAVEHDGPPESQ